MTNDTQPEQLAPEDLIDLLDDEVAELIRQHEPVWATSDGEQRGLDPAHCDLCWPAEDGWPCTSRRIGNRMHWLINGPDDPEN